MSRPADRALLLLALGFAACAACFLDAARLTSSSGDEEALRAHLVRALRLTDLALFTEARYTRHPSQADLHSAFQDHPLALEHFPTGSLLGPPASLRDQLVADERAGHSADELKVGADVNADRPADGPKVSPGGTAPRAFEEAR